MIPSASPHFIVLSFLLPLVFMSLSKNICLFYLSILWIFLLFHAHISHLGNYIAHCSVFCIFFMFIFIFIRLRFSAIDFTSACPHLHLHKISPLSLLPVASHLNTHRIKRKVIL